MYHKQFLFTFGGEYFAFTLLCADSSARFFASSLNNHPFRGLAGQDKFALAYNGVLYNDHVLQKIHHLPATPIKTDSYVAVQLLEKYGELSFDSLINMAQKLEGSFTITVMDKQNHLYIVRGNNPICPYHNPEWGLFLYASTQLLGNVFTVGIACQLNIRHHKISENNLSENFAQSCRPFQISELQGNIRENGSFKVTAECQIQLEPMLSVRRISRSSLPSEHLSEKKAAPSALVTDGVLA